MQEEEEEDYYTCAVFREMFDLATSTRPVTVDLQQASIVNRFGSFTASELSWTELQRVDPVIAKFHYTAGSTGPDPTCRPGSPTKSADFLSGRVRSGPCSGI